MRSAQTFAPSAVRPLAAGTPALLKSLAWIAAGAAAIALGAHAALPLPFTPVPVTMQTLAVLVVGAVLGSRRGTAAVLAYLAAGLMGVPVFAGGAAGLARLAGPTGGYLLGLAVAALIMGWCAERGYCDRAASRLAVLLGATAAIYACGLPWLALYAGWHQVLALGLVPFLAGDAAKLALAAAIIRPRASA